MISHPASSAPPEIERRKKSSSPRSSATYRAARRNARRGKPRMHVLTEAQEAKLQTWLARPREWTGGLFR